MNNREPYQDKLASLYSHYRSIMGEGRYYISNCGRNHFVMDNDPKELIAIKAHYDLDIRGCDREDGGMLCKHGIHEIMDLGEI